MAHDRLRTLGGRAMRALTSFSDRSRTFYWNSRLGHLGSDAYIYPRAIIYSPRNVFIGSRANINDFVHIRGGGGVEIGEDSLLAPHVVVTSQSHDVDALAKGLTYRQTNTTASVRIGANVWIGAGAVILPGVSIGDGAIIAAGAVVSKDVAAGTLVAGVPARFVRKLGS